MDIGVAVPHERLKGVVPEVTEGLAAVGAGRDARQQARLLAKR